MVSTNGIGARRGSEARRDTSDTGAIDTQRRVRLLALVEAGFTPAHVRRDGPRYPVATGDLQWFQDNIPCQRACPARTDVPGYIALIADGRDAAADAVNRDDNVFPGCLGRICARPCEDACRRKYVDAPVGIRNLKRAAADYRGDRVTGPPPRPNGRSVAIVGAGAAGLSAARGLARAGYRVAVYERLPVPGGMLAAAVPSWRLPRHVIQEDLRAITDLGVEIRCGVDVGRDVRLEDLIDTHDAVLLATGCPESVQLGIPGEDLDGVMGGLPYLSAVNLGAREALPAARRVVVVGGGFTSIDCVRTALRLGAERTTLIYRRSRDEIPVESEELDEAAREGVDYVFMASPVRILGKGGRVSGIELRRNVLGEPDASGRRRPEPVPGSEFVVPCDQAIVAVGQRQTADFDPNGLLSDVDRRGVVQHAADLRTNHPKVWVAGDYAADPRNFISAIADGKNAAASIDAALRGTRPVARDFALTRLPIDSLPAPLQDMPGDVAEWSLTAMSRRLRWGDDYLRTPRQSMPLLPVPERGLGEGDGNAPEVELGLGQQTAPEEASRCLQCQLNIFIDGTQCILCNGCVEACPHGSIEMVAPDRLAAIDGDVELARAIVAEYGGRAAAMVIDEEACIRCGMCVDWCPTGCLTMEHFRTRET